MTRTEKMKNKIIKSFLAARFGFDQKKIVLIGNLCTYKCRDDGTPEEIRDCSYIDFAVCGVKYCYEEWGCETSPTRGLRFKK